MAILVWAILFYGFFSCWWIRKLWKGLWHPIPEIPSFAEVCRTLNHGYWQQQDQSLEQFKAALVKDKDVNAEVVALLEMSMSRECVLFVIWEVAGFLLGVGLKMKGGLPASSVLPLILLVVLRLKVIEVQLARRLERDFQGKGILSVLLAMVLEDCTKWTGYPSFPFLVGCLNSMSSVSHGILIAQTFNVDASIQSNFAVLQSPLPLVGQLHLWQCMALSALLSHTWFLGLVFEPTAKPFHASLLMKVIGLDRLKALIDRNSTVLRVHAPSCAEEFWFTLDITTVRTLGAVLPNLWWQTAYVLAKPGGADLVAGVSVALSTLMALKQGLQLALALRAYAASGEAREYRRRLALLSAAAMGLLLALAGLLAGRLAAAALACPSRLWTPCGGCAPPR